VFANLFGTLTFIVTLIGCVGAILAVAFTLMTHRLRTAWRIGRLMLVWVGLYIAVLLAVSFTSPQHILDPGQEHCFDEMCFSVRDVITAKTWGTGPHPMTAHGRYYVLTVQLHNAAKRVPQRPDSAMMWIADQQGRQYTDWVNAQETPEEPLGGMITAQQIWYRRLEPGESMTHTIAFDLPVDAAQPSLVITEGSGPTLLIIGDENSFFHSKTAFRLTPVRHDATSP
jgi:hypothetical protein